MQGEPFCENYVDCKQSTLRVFFENIEASPCTLSKKPKNYFMFFRRKYFFEIKAHRREQGEGLLICKSSRTRGATPSSEKD